jgi:hypothetical protein
VPEGRRKMLQEEIIAVLHLARHARRLGDGG